MPLRRPTHTVGENDVRERKQEELMSNGNERQCVVRFRLEAGDVDLLVHGHNDGSWNVSEGKGRTLAAAGSPNPDPQTVVKIGQSDSPEKIEADVIEWAAARYKATFQKKPC
jgi:hypothetical protein